MSAAAEEVPPTSLDVVEFSEYLDFLCGYCRTSRLAVQCAMAMLQKENPELKFRPIYKPFPLLGFLGDQEEREARAFYTETFNEGGMAIVNNPADAPWVQKSVAINDTAQQLGLPPVVFVPLKEGELVGDTSAIALRPLAMGEVDPAKIEEYITVGFHTQFGLGHSVHSREATAANLKVAGFTEEEIAAATSPDNKELQKRFDAAIADGRGLRGIPTLQFPATGVTLAKDDALNIKTLRDALAAEAKAQIAAKKTHSAENVSK